MSQPIVFNISDLNSKEFHQEVLGVLVVDDSNHFLVVVVVDMDRLVEEHYSLDFVD